ncbi:MAG: hypothetical protein QOE42_1768 [Chloroflexota bacterium]|jgi:hypothetical protein|nr:hypothetical protein [Chloroflexota bacterium]
MDLVRTVANIETALIDRAHPAVTRWNRLEGRPRAHDFGRALRAEVRDAMWMLSRQWQLGEFAGEDAGSPALARAVADITHIAGYHPGSAPDAPLDVSLPLDTIVERRPIPVRAGTQYLSLDLRLAVGRRWMKMLAASAAEPSGVSDDYRPAYRAAYAIPLPDPTDRAQSAVAGGREPWQMAAAVAGGRAVDGIALIEHARAPGAEFFDGVGASNADEPILAGLGGRLVDWFGSLIIAPANGPDAWEPERLEYQFGLSAPDGDGSLGLLAAEYLGAGLDWYRVDLGVPGPAPAAATPPSRVVRTVLPTPVSFEGMPATRWWSFEDRRTNLGDVRPDTTDLAKLLLLEFALVYGNDWFVIPLELGVGQIAEVHGVAVTNVFGERRWVARSPAEVGPGNRWSLFAMSPTPEAVAANVTADPLLVMLPTAGGVQEGPVNEEVAFVRDEVANMVWAVERRVPSSTGASRPGAEAGRETRAFFERIAEAEVQAAGGQSPVAPPAAVASIRYVVQTSVPEQWIPFIPVHVPGDNREIQLQRAAMPRILVDGTTDRVAPRTVIVGGVPTPAFVFEEEIPRAGIRVRQAYRRARWHHGGVATWISVAKEIGRGEGSSGLQFDTIINPPQK